MSERNEYITKMEQQLEKMNKKMAQLGDNAKAAQADAQGAYKEKVAKLRQQSKVATAKLEEMRTSGEDAWGTMVTEMEKMHDSFTHAFFSMFQIPTTSWSQTTADKTADKKPKADPAEPAKKS